MASESGERHITVTVPGWVDEWLEERATDAEVSRDEYVDHLLEAAFTTVASVQRESTEFDTGDPAASFSVLLAEVESVFEHLMERHESDLDAVALKEDFGEKITDVRNRVVQLKHELAEKAAEDHVHPSLRQNLEETHRQVEQNASAAETLREDLDSFDDSVNQGFDNFETVLEYLTERADLLERRYNRLARTTVSLKQRLDSVDSAEANRKRADALKREANKNGFRSASCSGCGGTVHLDLLGAPQCPHCEETFDGVEPKTGLFGSHTLTVGETPALESGDAETGFKFGRVQESSEEAEGEATLKGIRGPDGPDSP